MKKIVSLLFFSLAYGLSGYCQSINIVNNLSDPVDVILHVDDGSNPCGGSTASFTIPSTGSVLINATNYGTYTWTPALSSPPSAYVMVEVALTTCTAGSGSGGTMCSSGLINAASVGDPNCGYSTSNCFFPDPSTCTTQPNNLVDDVFIDWNDLGGGNINVDINY